jgi:hypothetical protein
MSRAYDIDGTEYPSVTTVLDCLGKGDGLLYWAVGLAMTYIRQNRGLGLSLDELLDQASRNWMTVKEEAANIGSEIHSLIERYIKEGKDAIGAFRPEVEHGFLAFLEWERVHGIKWIKSEMQIVSREFGYAGTLDAICLYEGRAYVIDFKSSKAFNDTMGMQIAAYRNAAAEMGHSIEGMGILRLDKLTGEPEWKDYSASYAKDRAAFLKLLDFYYAAKKRRLKNNRFVLKSQTLKKETIKCPS